MPQNCEKKEKRFIVLSVKSGIRSNLEEKENTGDTHHGSIDSCKHASVGY